MLIEMFGAHNYVQKHVHNDMWWILIGCPPAFTPTIPIKTHHITCHIIMYKFYVRNYVHLTLPFLLLHPLIFYTQYFNFYFNLRKSQNRSMK